jgi:hypothetical protein
MVDYEAVPSRPDLAEKAAALREAGLSIGVWRSESQIAGPDGSAHPPSWACQIASLEARLAVGEGSTEHEAFEDAYGQLPDLPGRLA